MNEASVNDDEQEQIFEANKIDDINIINPNITFNEVNNKKSLKKLNFNNEINNLIE